MFILKVACIRNAPNGAAAVKALASQEFRQVQTLTVDKGAWHCR